MLLVLACTQAPAPSEEQPPSLVLVTLDTTRADRIGVYGHPEAQTPVLDELAGEGVRFERAYTPVPLTTPAHASMMTGLLPPRHGVRSNGEALSADLNTLAESLSSTGFRTGAMVSSVVLDRTWGLDQGFAAFDDTLDKVHVVGGQWMQERGAEATTDAAVTWLQNQLDEQAFLWVHYYDAHYPYSPPAPLSDYDGEITFVDTQLGRLIEAADDRGPTIFMVVGDHGEGFGHRGVDDQQGELAHGMFLFESTMRVPFIVRPAAPMKEAKVVNQVVSLVDVMPTALSLLGVDVPPALDGRDLTGALEGDLPPGPGAYLESMVVQRRFGFPPEVGWVQGDLKLLDGPTPQLFHIGDETRSVAEEQPALVAELRANIAAVREVEVPQAVQDADSRVVQAMEALGYLVGGASPKSDVDARAKLAFVQPLERAHRHLAEGNGQAAVDGFHLALEAQGGIAEGWRGLAKAQHKLGLQEAEASMRQALALAPTDPVLSVELAGIMMDTGHKADAIEGLEEALVHHPQNRQLRSTLLRGLTRVDRQQESLNRAREWLKGDPDDAGLHAHLGVVLTQMRRTQEAAPHLDQAVVSPLPHELVHASLGQLALNRGDQVAALAHFAAEAEAFSHLAGARILYGRALIQAQQFPEAAQVFQTVAEGPELEVEGRLGWVQSLLLLQKPDDAMSKLGPLLTEEHRHNPAVLSVHHRVLLALGHDDEAAAKQAELQQLVSKRRAKGKGPK